MWITASVRLRALFFQLQQERRQPLYRQRPLCYGSLDLLDCLVDDRGLLVWLYREGRGVPQDSAKAAEWDPEAVARTRRRNDCFGFLGAIGAMTGRSMGILEQDQFCQ